MKSSARLLCVVDPLCGWCYAAGPLLRAAQAHFGEALELVWQPGLLFAQPTLLAEDWRAHIIAADARIAALAGVPFGAAYLARLRGPAPISLHSLPTMAAVLACAPARQWHMLEAVQHAHYVEGCDVCDDNVLQGLALALGETGGEFAGAMAAQRAALPQAADAARALLQAAGGQGLPCFVLEQGARRVRVVPTYGDAAQFVQAIATQLS